MGGVDKGLQPYNGMPLARHALHRLQPKVGQVAVNANRHLPDYQAMGVPVWPDELADYPGPLAGFLTGLLHCSTPCLLTVPCDAPRFPADLAERLLTALNQDQSEIAMACGIDASDLAASDFDKRPLKLQPVFGLMRLSVLPSLRQFLDQGERKVEHWAQTRHISYVNFDQPHDDPLAFFNANTLDELRYIERTSSSHTL
jgi:molybdopterin-guanine dinucleotide biosynthesis protein A